ncbi:MAG: hypothetical protein CR993_05115 [Rhodobacterales bacterium]|nr:MAG: hypothetical protein CR993_05115 [Rhodobacterales bacterium]
MQYDLFLTIGIIVLALAIPPVFSAVVDGQPPRVAAIMFLIGGALIAFAVTQSPSGYTLQDVPNAIIRVIGHYLN